MKPRLITISEDTTVYETALKIKQGKVGSLLVQNQAGLPCGIDSGQNIEITVEQKSSPCKIAELENKPNDSVQATYSTAAETLLIG